MKKSLKIFLFLLTGLNYENLKGQESQNYYPKEGQILRNYVFKDVVNHSTRSISINDFRGKWLILDFWGRGCPGCIASFPKMNRLDSIFKDEVKILMVGMYSAKSDFKNSSYSEETLIKTLYDKQRKRFNLKFAVAFDSLSQKEFDIGFVPTVFIINPSGTIVAKTHDVDSMMLRKLMLGQKVIYKKAYSANEPMNSTAMSDARKKEESYIDTNVLVRSEIGRWVTSMPYIPSGLRDLDLQSKLKERPFKTNIYRVDLPSLIMYGYTGSSFVGIYDRNYGQLSPRIIVETLDTSRFQLQDLDDDKNLYYYKLLSYQNNLNGKTIRKYLIKDLEKQFDFRSSVESRKAPVWNLVVLDQKKVNKLRTTGKAVQFNDLKGGGKDLKNVSVKDFLTQTLFQAVYRIHHFDMRVTPPVVDKTNLGCNIDIVFDADISNFEESKRELNKHGLDLVLNMIDMNCIVVRDSN